MIIATDTFIIFGLKVHLLKQNNIPTLQTTLIEIAGS